MGEIEKKLEEKISKNTRINKVKDIYKVSQEKSDPDWLMTLWKYFLSLLTGDTICRRAEMPPESEPIKVTELGSPPKEEI